MAEYGDFQSAAHAQKGGNVHVWWRAIGTLPTQENIDEVRSIIEDDAVVYKMLGYKVDLMWSSDRDDADLHIHHKHTPTSNDIALLKGLAASTWIRAGWGGGS